MIVDGSQLSGSADQLEADVIVVGAGAVGLTLAIRLAQLGKSVVVLEAGDTSPSVDYIQSNEGINYGLQHRGLRQGRMKALGGTTRLWGGQLVPFEAKDFESRSYDGKKHWPVSYAEIQPFFSEAFEILGVGEGVQDTERVWRAVTKRLPEFGKDLTLGMNLWLPQPDFSRLFRRWLHDPKGPQIVTNSEVKRLLFEEGRRVRGLEVAIAGGEVCRLACRQLVLANGTFEAVRLLLRAVETPGSPLQHNKNVGKFFIDHLHGIAGAIAVKDQNQLRDLFDHVFYNRHKYSVKIRTTDDFSERMKIANCVGTINTPNGVGSLFRDSLMLARRIVDLSQWRQSLAAANDASKMARILLPLAWRYLIERRATSLLDNGVFLGLEIEQIPTAASYIRLDASQHPDDAPIALHWAFDGREMRAANEVCKAIDAEFRASGLGEIQIDPRILDEDQTFLTSCHDSYHHMGGACMGENAEEAVVDRNLKVFGTDNLYVSGAATFPSGSFANPTLTAIAFGMRLAKSLGQI
ncbi:hypothetical protein XI07_18355 [Bradyrhizobium sp. CCBAU 11445]|uniref:FAD-dependent oxidoreductase n=1 Tax=unclassified Bradyrhizobium TaxID=2631580 RepID=UPI0023063885|nr:MULTISPECIES: GMC family oxidoreductase [unclassified Bradyrhizobium]MDA9418922.1 hypothetical protein [Bradyrhizobium sp. CCBAU 25360]MDA9483942.1 hypothetical protein [Bradyrhizobium sp. CCBAU 11445]